MEHNGKYIYRGEKYFLIIFYLVYLSLFVFGNEPGDILFGLSVFLILLGYMIKVLIGNKTVFHKAAKPEFFYKATRNPYLFATFLQIIPIIFYMHINFVSLIFLFFLLFSMFFVLQKSESFYISIYSAYNVYKNEVPIFFPKLNLKPGDLFKRENRNIPLFDKGEILHGLIPLLVIIAIRFDALKTLWKMVSDLL